MRKLLLLGLRPTLAIVESGTGNWAEAERRWITHYKTENCALTNLTEGGEGTPGYIPTAETRAKMSVAHLGLKQTPESTAKTRAALLGRKQSPEHVAKLSAARKGKPIPAATTAAALKVRGSKQSPEHIAKRITPLIGGKSPHRKLSDDAVRHIRTETAISLAKMAKLYGVGQTTVFEIRHRMKYLDVPDAPQG